MEGIGPTRGGEGSWEDFQRLEIDEVTLLVESVPECTSTDPDIRGPAVWYPSEAPHLTTARGEVCPDACGEGDPLEARRLLDREVVLIDPVTELRVRFGHTMTDPEDEICARMYPDPDIELQSGTTEIPTSECQLLGSELEEVAARIGKGDSTTECQGYWWWSEEKIRRSPLRLCLVGGDSEEQCQEEYNPERNYSGLAPSARLGPLASRAPALWRTTYQHSEHPSPVGARCDPAGPHRDSLPG